MSAAFRTEDIEAAIARTLEDNAYMRDWDGDEGLSFLYGYACAELGRGASAIAGLRDHVRDRVLEWRAEARS